MGHSKFVKPLTISEPPTSTRTVSSLKQHLTTRSNIMSDQSSQRSPSPVEYAMTHPCEEVLQSLWDGHLTAAAAAPKLAAITIPDPNIDLEEIEGHLWILWGKVLTCLEKVPGRLKTVADLISHISSLRPVLTKSGEQLALDEGTQHAWQDLPVLGWHLGERFNCEYCRSISRAIC